MLNHKLTLNLPEHVVCLPVPEKAIAAYNFCIFPRYGDGVTISPNQIQIYEPIVWTVNEIKSKDPDVKALSLREQIIAYLEERKLKVLEPNAGEFVSEAPQAQRKGEKVYHVKAFRGSKDGMCRVYFSSYDITFNFELAANTSTSLLRLSLLPLNWHSVGLQKTIIFLLIRPHLLNLLHLRPPTYFQS